MDKFTQEIMDVDVSLGFHRQPSPKIVQESIEAGIKIMVGENELTRYRNQDQLEEENFMGYESAEYKGDIIYQFLVNVSTHTIGLLTGSYEGSAMEESDYPDPCRCELRAEVYAWHAELVLSRLDGKHIRVAFQDDIPGREEPYTYLRANLGYAVDGNEFGEEILGCVKQLFSYAQKCGIDESGMPDLKKNRDRLEEILD